MIETLLDYQDTTNLHLILGTQKNRDGVIGLLSDFSSTASSDLLCYAQKKILASGDTLLSFLLTANMLHLLFLYCEYIPQRSYAKNKYSWQHTESLEPSVILTSDANGSTCESTTNSEENEVNNTIAMFDEIIQTSLFDTIMTFQPSEMFSLILSEFDAPEVAIRNLLGDFMSPLQPRTSIMYDIYTRLFFSSLSLFDQFAEKFEAELLIKFTWYISLLSSTVEDFMTELSTKFTSKTLIMENNLTKAQNYLLKNSTESLIDFTNMLSKKIENIYSEDNDCLARRM